MPLPEVPLLDHFWVVFVRHNLRRFGLVSITRSLLRLKPLFLDLLVDTGFIL